MTKIRVKNDEHTAVQVIRQIYRDVYGEEPTVQELKDFTRIKARDDVTKVMQDPQKDDELIVETILASERVTGAIREQLATQTSEPPQVQTQDPPQMDPTPSQLQEEPPQTTDYPQVNDDGSITFLPPRTKEGAEYKRNNDHAKNCEGCAHYIEGGACHVVQGRIHPDAVCHNYYADVGVFGDDVSDLGKRNPLLFRGHGFDWSESDVQEFLDRLRKAL